MANKKVKCVCSDTLLVGVREAYGAFVGSLMSVLDLVTDVPVLVTDCRNGCLDVSIGRCESA